MLNLPSHVKEDLVGDMTCIGIFAKNREEWAITALACLTTAVTIVPFYDSLGP